MKKIIIILLILISYQSQGQTAKQYFDSLALVSDTTKLRSQWLISNIRTVDDKLDTVKALLAITFESIDKKPIPIYKIDGYVILKGKYHQIMGHLDKNKLPFGKNVTIWMIKTIN